MKKIFLFLALAMTVMAGCSKSDDPFNDPAMRGNNADDSVSFHLSSTILTPVDFSKYYGNAYIIQIILDDGVDFFEIDLNPGSSITLKGENAKALIGKEILITPKLSLFYVYSWDADSGNPSSRSADFPTSFNPAPMRFVVEKNANYDFHFDITFQPL